jgi:hypothetical protein
MLKWVEEELRGVKFSDLRLKRRLQQMVERLIEMPAASIPQAMGSWAQTKAAYRFLDSEKVTAQAIRAAGSQATLRRIDPEKKVLIIQDTTMLDFTQHRATSGLGYLASAYHRGIILHSALVTTTAGVPLGILDQTTWTRDPHELGKRHRRKQRPFAEKESAKWVKTLKASIDLIPKTISSLTIADSEADMYEIFATPRSEQADLLIRACRDRRLAGEENRLWETVMASPVKGEIEVNLEARPKRPARIARCNIRFVKVVMRSTAYCSTELRHHQGVSLYAILVLEEAAPKGVKPLEWMLLTTLKIESLENALQIVRWYGLRWIIEQYHFTLKSGCQIEKLQLESAERLERALAVYSVVAWRLLWLTYEARQAPEASCENAFERHEWQALYCKINKTQEPPLEPPSLRQAVRWIAQLGGFLGRKSDGEPGVKTLWRGMRRLEDIVDDWLIFRSVKDVGNDEPPWVRGSHPSTFLAHGLNPSLRGVFSIFVIDYMKELQNLLKYF